MEVNLSDNLADLGNLSKDMVKRGLELTSMELIRNLMINSPVDHGLLKQWAVTSQTDTEIVVQSPAEYAVYQNYGTSAHWVEPKSALALHWDGTYFSKGHMVSGIEAKHFVEDSIEQTMPRIQEFFTINGGS